MTLDDLRRRVRELIEEHGAAAEVLWADHRGAYPCKLFCVPPSAGNPEPVVYVSKLDG